MIEELSLESEMPKDKEPNVMTWMQLGALCLMFLGMSYWNNETIQISINSLEKNLNQKIDVLWNDVFTRKANAAGISDPQIRTIAKTPQSSFDAAYNSDTGVRMVMIYKVNGISGDDVTFTVYPKVYQGDMLQELTRPKEFKVRMNAQATLVNQIIDENTRLKIGLPAIRIALVGQSGTQLVVATDKFPNPG